MPGVSFFTVIGLLLPVAVRGLPPFLLLHETEYDVTALPPAERGVAMAFQNYALFPHLSVADKITFGLSVRKMAAAESGHRLRLEARMRELGLTVPTRASSSLHGRSACSFRKWIRCWLESAAGSEGEKGRFS